MCRIKYLGFVSLIIVLTGCATVTRGRHEILSVESEPSGADVRLSTGLTGTTPATFEVRRRSAFVVYIEKEGYEPVEVQVQSQIAGAGAAGMAGNVVLGGLIGAAVDAGTGSTHEIVPNPIQVTLVPINKVEQEPEAEDVEELRDEGPIIDPVSYWLHFESSGECEQKMLLSITSLPTHG